MSSRREDETKREEDAAGRPPDGPEDGLEEWLQRLQARADSSADVSSRAFSGVLWLVLVLLGLLALFALISRLIGS